ncbi:MAG: carbonic anhydrase [Bacteriovorax sp.]
MKFSKMTLAFLFGTLVLSSSGFTKEEHSSPHSTETQAAEHSAETKAQGHGAGHAEHKREPSSITADKALSFLKNGNLRYTHALTRRDGASTKDRERLVTGQQPHAVVLSCSDSRVPPEIIFDQKLGEIFVVRTAGQSLDSMTIASIEYAVSHLGSNLIIVMGHESCGAVKAALATLKGGDAGSPWLNKLVADLHPRLKRFSELSQTDGVIVESWVNVEGVSHDLIERSELIRNLVESGEVKIQNALYHLGSGAVEWR